MNNLSSLKALYRRQRNMCLLMLPVAVAVPWFAIHSKFVLAMVPAVVSVLFYLSLLILVIILRRDIKKLESIAMMTCDWCGRQFEADPRCCLEGGITMDASGLDEWQKAGDVLDEKDRDNLKQQFGLDDAQVEALIENGEIEGIGSIVCLECQNNAVSDHPDDE